MENRKSLKVFLAPLAEKKAEKKVINFFLEMPNVAYRLTDNVYSGVTNCYAQCDTNTITFTVGFKLHNFKEFSSVCIV